MKLINKLTIFTILVLLLLSVCVTVNAATTESYAPQQNDKAVTVTSMLWDGTVVEAEKPVNVAVGGMAQLSAKASVTYNGKNYSFSHFEYHTTARNYVASYTNPMEFYVDPPMTIYAIYTDGTHNTDAYVVNGSTGFYKDPAVVAGNTFFYGCIAAPNASVESTAINAIISIATKTEGPTTQETIPVAQNTADSTTRVFQSTLNSAQFVVSEPLDTALNVVIEGNGITNKAQTKIWDMGSDAFNEAAALTQNSTNRNNFKVNGLTFSKLAGQANNDPYTTVNDVTYKRGVKLNKDETTSFNVTKGDIIEIYARGNQATDTTLAVTNGILKSADNNIGNNTSKTLSVKTYVAEKTGEFSVAFAGQNAFIYCIKVNPINPVKVEGATETTSAAITETTTAITETTTETTTADPVESNYVWVASAPNDLLGSNFGPGSTISTCTRSGAFADLIFNNGTTGAIKNQSYVSFGGGDTFVPARTGVLKLYATHNSSGKTGVKITNSTGDVVKTFNLSGRDVSGIAAIELPVTAGETYKISNGGYLYRAEITSTPEGPTQSTESTTEATTTTTTTTTEATTKETTTETTTDAPTPSAGAKIHNFTENGTDSNYYTITGKLSSDKGTVNYNGLTLTQCLKMESATNISFENTAKGKITLVLGQPGTIKVDGTKYTATNGVITVDLEPGRHTITKADTANLFYMSYEDTVVIDPTKGSINATVTNNNGNKVTGATVTATSGSKTVTLTEANGVYTAINVEPGAYVVKAVMTINGQTYENTANVTVTANGKADPSIKLNYGTGNISITVVNTFNGANTPISNATVTAKSSTNDEITLKYSNGAYVANDVFATSYTVTAQKDSASGTANVNVEAGKTATAQIGLSIDPNAFLYVDVQKQLTTPPNLTNTKTVTTYDELTNAVADFNSTGGTIYINAPKIECEDQIKITGSNVALVGKPQGNNTFPILDFSRFRASVNGINAAAPMALSKGVDTDAGIRIQGNHNLIQNLIVEKAPDNGIQIKAGKDSETNLLIPGLEANYNKIENCIARYNNDTGIQVSAPEPANGTNYQVLASYNEFKWCYSYRNCDVYGFGGNADGFAPKLNPRTGNVFDHCYAWDNSDDGWDGYDKSAKTIAAGKTGVSYSEYDDEVTADITYTNSACWNNGNRDVFTGDYDATKGYPVDTNLFVYEILKSQNVGFNGTNFKSVKGNASLNTSKGVKTWSSWYDTAAGEMNGNGFKFGSADTPGATQWTDSNGTKTYEMKRVVTNCLAFNHKNSGFDRNNTSGINGYFENTVAFDNGINYHLDGYIFKKWINVFGFNGSDDKGSKSTEPSSTKQSEIRAEVEDKAYRMFEACQNNVIPGGAEFNIYN